ncbi:conjugal transfer protein TraH [Hippea maritima]|uniref:TraH family protein n=1 Tax=Hippea maritima (strain ATCC 700847 / DSM 10411 / MH2) TaxID=760142 RepID=F2LV55_HIPMA|nr:conjugal transfer protein TraH [Hippea maritima]AEA33639.1 TraH family protein [Hippea maritima DSM 10411]
MLRKIVVVLIIAALTTASYQARADWVSDWVQQKTSLAPNYFKGQKRGYFTFGSFSARWQPSQTTYLFDIQKPSLKIGCGGIDIFGGGFNFVNPQYLVQQLQTMLQAAPAVAFDIALKTLCEQCSQTIKSIEGMIQRLNGLQFNACKASKIMLTKVVDAISPDSQSSERASADQSHNVLTGAVDLFNEIFESEQSITPSSKPSVNQPASAQTDYDKMIADCPQDIKDIFAASQDNPNTTILEGMAKKLNIPEDYVDLIRGFVGDIRIVVAQNSQGKKELKIVLMGPCAKNDSTKTNEFYNGTAYAENDTGECYSANTKNLIQYVQDNMYKIIQKMKDSDGSNRALSDEEQSIIQTSPVSVYQALKASVIVGDTDTVASLLSDITAKAYAYGALSDLYSRAVHLFYRAEEAITKEGNFGPSCQLSITAANVKILRQFINTIYTFQQTIKNDYIKSANEVNALGFMTNNFRKARQIVMQEISDAVNTAAIQQQ